MAATVYDIARKAKVSAATVSRVLNGRGGAGPVTVRRIHRAAERLRFRPATVTNELFSVVIPVSTKPHFFASYYLAQMLSGVSDVLFAAGCEMKFLPLAWDSPAVAGDPVRALKRRHADAVIFPYATGGREHIDRVAKAGFPHAVAVAGFTAPHIYIADCDHYQAAARAVEYLCDLGHRAVGMIGAPLDHPAHGERLRAWREVCARRLGAVDEDLAVLAGGTKSEDGYAAALRLLAGRRRPTAVFAGNDNIALGIYRAVHKLGLVVPRDLSVVGFDDYEFCEYLSPPLTTVRQPIYEIGRAAAEAVVRQLRGGRAERLTVIPAELMIRESAAPAGRRGKRCN